MICSPAAKLHNGRFNNIDITPKRRQISPSKLNKTEPHIHCPKKAWCIGDFEIGKMIGKGSFGKVFIAREKKSGAIVALKQIYKKEIMLYRLQNQLKNEIEIQSSMLHPNIIRLYGVFYDTNSIYMILEYANGGSLFSDLSQRGVPHESVAASHIKSIASTLQYLHSNNIIHRDIKPENLLLCNGILKIADFGCCSQGIELRNTLCGTPLYIAPEIQKHLPYNNSVDVWSLGMLAYEITGGFLTKVQADNIKSTQCTKLIFAQKVSASAKEFIQTLLQINPVKRPSIKDILQSEWIKKNALI